MDPELWELFEAGDSNDEVAAILRLGQPGIVPEGVQIVTGFGDIFTVRIKRGATKEVRESEPVSSMKSGGASFGPDVQLIESELFQEALPERLTATDQRRPSLLTATGRGVVVGAVDWGFDFAHPDFRQLDGKTRILALWDQRGPARPGSPRPYGYGIAHTREAIDRALASPDPYAALGYHPADSDTGQGAHGTHVLSIAAGNGGGGGPTGIAPEADLVLVHSANWGSAETSLGDSVTLLEAIDFILRLAGERPCVINLSMGRHCGQHDGSTLVEQGLDAALRAAPGRAICQSAGNYFERRVHAAGQLRPGLKHNLTWEITEADATPNQLEIWYSWRDEIEVEISSPDAAISARARLGERTVVKADGREIGKLYHRAREPNTLDNHIVIFLYKQAPQGPWKLSLIPIDIIDGRFHAWIERDAACPSCQSIFRKEDAVSSSTTGTICNGLRTIAVGAYDPHNSERPIAHFSSAGPTRDGRIKPDLCAPGVRILAARSAPRGLEDNPPLLTCMSGTSMAAPCATGTVALMFEVAPRRLRIEETHTLLLGSAEAFSSDGEQMERGGSGYLDITAAVEAARTVGATNVGSRPQLESKRMASESQLEMESDQAQEDQDKIEGPESSDEKHFLLISGGPGPYAKGDPEHDQSWANYVTSPLLLAEGDKKKKEFIRSDETITWLIYRPAYETRWSADESSKMDVRKKEVKRIKAIECKKDHDCTSYIDFLELRASQRNWDLKWITKAEEIWDHIRSLPKNSISRVYYWGHAREDLWLSLTHQIVDGKPVAWRPEDHEILERDSIKKSLRNRFRKGTISEVHRFIGCNTARFAEEWADKFEVAAEGVEGKVNFESIHQSGGEPCLVKDAEVKLYLPDERETERKKWHFKAVKCSTATGESLKEASDELSDLSAIAANWDSFPNTYARGNGDRLMEPAERFCAECEARHKDSATTRSFNEDDEPLGRSTTSPTPAGYDGPRLIHRADDTARSGNNDRSSALLIGEILSELGHTSLDRTDLSARVLFDAFTQGGGLPHFELIGTPGMLVTVLPRPGDIICRRGEAGLAHASVIASSDLWRREQLNAAGLTAEGPRLGIYVRIVETGWQPRVSSHQFSRLLAEPDGRVPHNQLLLRPKDAAARESSFSLLEALPAPFFGPPTAVSGWILGVDLYEANAIDAAGFVNLKNKGKMFAILKCSQGTYADSRFIPANRSDDYYRFAREAGMIRGSYHFFANKRGKHAASFRGSIADQANLVVQQVKRLAPGDLAPALDLEDEPRRAGLYPLDQGQWPDETGYNYRRTRQGLQELLSDIQDFLDRVETALGRTPIIYTSRMWGDSDMMKDPHIMSQYPLWNVFHRMKAWKNVTHADLDTLPLGGWGRNWTFLQYAEQKESDKNGAGYKEPGINVDGIDFNAHKGTIHTLRGLADLGRTAPHLVGNQEFIAYSKADGSVHLLCFNSGVWRDEDISSANRSAPLAAGDPAAIVTSAGEQIVAYRAKDDRIHAFTRPTRGSSPQWSLVELTETAAYADPFVSITQDAVRVLYWGESDQQVLLTRSSNKWHAERLMDQTYPASGSAVAYSYQDRLHIVSRGGRDGHLIDFAVSATGTTTENLTATAHAEANIPAATYRPATYVPPRQAPRIVFRALRGTIWQIERDTLHATNLSDAAGAPLATGSPSVVVGDAIHILFRGIDGVINEIFTEGGSWKTRSVCTDAAADPCAYIDCSSRPALSFLTSTGSIRVGRFINGAWRCEDAQPGTTTTENWAIDAESSRAEPQYIRWIQESLNKVLGTQLTPDGTYNPETRGAIRQFQRQEGLLVDGNVGPITERALLQAVAVPPPSPITEDLPGSALPLPCPGPTHETISRFPRYSNSAEALPAEERDKIRVLAQFIVRSFQAGCTPIGTVRLLGHADRDPERESREPGFEVNVSLRRAEAIEKALKDLIHDPGISSHIGWDHRGAGSSDLAVPNAATELERQRNRRVEVLLIPASVPPPPPPPPLPPPPPPSVITCPAPLTPPVGPPGAPADVTTLIRIVGVVLHGVPLGMAGASVPTAARFLDSREQSEAITMYGGSLDFTKIVITDGIGFSGRPFTVAVPLSSGFHVAMNLGDLCSWASPPRSHTLIHELAHAWQSQHHGSDPTAFMRNSVECQVRAIADIPLAKGAAASTATATAIAHGVFDPLKLASIAAAAAAAEDVSAYAYIPHKPFAEYAAEQIAEQVEHSYRHACCPTPAIAAAVRSFGLHVRSPDNETSLTVISFHRKSIPGVVFV